MFSSQLGTQSVPAAITKPEHGLGTGTAATTRLLLGSIRKTKSVGLLFVQTWSSPIASQSGLPSMGYSASGMMLDIGCCTPGTPVMGGAGSCANIGTMVRNLTSRMTRIRFMMSPIDKNAG